MRILFSTTNLDLGGAQMFIMRLAEEFRQQGHEVYVYNHQPEWSNREFQSSFSDVKIISYSNSPGFISMTWKLSGLLSRINKKFVFRNWFNERMYRRTLRKYNFDVVNSQMYFSDKVNARVIEGTNIPLVITTHGEYELNISIGNVHYNSEAKKCINNASAIIYTAEKNIEAIKALISETKPVRKICVGFNGDAIKRHTINPATLGITKDDFVIGMVARGIPEKGWKELIESFIALQQLKLKKRIKLVLIGNGERLKAEFEKHRIDGMHLLQFDSNPMEYFSWIAHFDAGLLLSYFKGESMPNAIIEYLYHGIPVLSTSIGEIGKMISSAQGLAGELIPLKDGKADVEAVVGTLRKWIENPELYAKLKGNTVAAFEKFRMRTIAGEYMEVYQRAIEESSRFRN